MESTADKGERSAVGQSRVGVGLPASSTLPQVRASWGEGPVLLGVLVNSY